MVKEVIHDPIFLAGKSELAAKEDLQVAQDLCKCISQFGWKGGNGNVWSLSC